VEWLLEQKEIGAFDVLKRYLEDDKTDAWDKTGILRTYIKHDLKRAKELAPPFLKHKEAGLRLAAALIVFQTGDKSEPRKVLGDSLATGSVDGWLADAVELLLKDDASESKEAVRRVFTNRALRHERESSRQRILRACATAGMKEPYEFYLPLLDIKATELPHLNEKGEPSGASYFEPSVAEAFTKEIVSSFAPDDPGIKEIVRKHPKTADQVPKVKQWAIARLDALKK
jgi:hypothetical protein